VRRAGGWWWRFPALMALVGGFFVALVPAGWVLAQVSDAVFGVSR
jgi:hypothetical protein